MTTAAYDALATEAHNNPKLLKVCKADLHTHDHAILTHRDSPNRFGWILTTSATHLVREDISKNGRDDFSAAFNPISGSCRSATNRFYVWDGSQLRSVNHEEMFWRLAEWRGELALAA